MCATKNQFDHIEEKFAKSRQIFLSKRSDANPELDPRILYNYSGSGTFILDPAWPKNDGSGSTTLLDLKTVEHLPFQTLPVRISHSADRGKLHYFFLL